MSSPSSATVRALDLSSEAGPGVRHGATQAPGRPSVHSLAQAFHRLADLATDAATILEGMATVAENLGDSAGNGDIQLDGVRGPSLIDTMNSNAEPPSPGTDLDLLSVADVARILGVGVRTIRRWRGEGKLPPALEFGGLLRWRRDAVEEWIAERGAGAGAEGASGVRPRGDRESREASA